MPPNAALERRRADALDGSQDDSRASLSSYLVFLYSGVVRPTLQMSRAPRRHDRSGCRARRLHL